MLEYKTLNDYLDVNVLKKIQDDLAEITGIAYNIIDFKGTPINNYSNFSSFCSKIRNTKEGLNICSKANAHAGLEAALRREPYIFICPAGLIDVSVPIIINGNYIGAVLLGQVKLKGSKSKVKKLNCYSEKHEISTKFQKEYNEIPYIDYTKIKRISSLVSTIVNQLIKKNFFNSIKEELDYNNIKLIKEKEDKIKLKEELKLNNLKLTQSKLNPYFLFNSLNSISKLALIENAPKTEDMIYNLAEILRYNIKYMGKKVSLKEEINNMLYYLKIQSVRFKDRLNYKININENIKHCKIPSMILQCFIENAILHGICPKKEGGLILIDGKLSENNIIITILDDGIGISKDKLFNMLSTNNKDGDMSICTINNFIISTYGENYKIKIKSEVNVGTTVELKFPLEY